MQSFLPKFLNVSSFALAVPFALWALAGAAHAWRSSRASFRVPGRVALAAGLALALNPLVGGYCGLLLLLWLFPGMLRHHDREAGFWLLGGLGALLFALPFLLPALRPAPHGGPEIQVQLGSQPLFDLLGPLFLLLAPALFGLRRFEVSRRWRWAAGAALAALLLVGARLPWGNQYKMARLGALLWALPTGAWLAERVHRPRLIVLLVILALPTTLAVPWAYLSWARDTPPLPLVWEDGALRPRSLPGRPTLPVSILEVEAAADPAAVLLADPYGLAGQLGGGRVQGQPLAPLFHHPLVVDALQVHNEGQPDLARRLACANALWNPDPMRIPFSATSGLARLRALLPERPFLILARREDHRLLEALSRAGATVLRDEQGFSLWRLPPLRPGGGS